MSKANTFLARLPASAPADLADDIRSAFGIVDRFKGIVAEISADRRFTAEGRQERINEALKTKALGHMRQMESKVDGLIAGSKAEHAKFKPAAPDKSDLYSEMQRREVRDYLRSLSEVDRLRVVYGTDDPLIREAIAHAPAVLSGLSEEHKGRVVDTLVQSVYGERAARLDEIDEGLMTARGALQVAAEDLRREAGLDPAQYAAL